MPFAPEEARHKRFKAAAFDAGQICYPMGGTIDGRRGDHVLIAPPFIISDDQIGDLEARDVSVARWDSSVSREDKDALLRENAGPMPRLLSVVHHALLQQILVGATEEDEDAAAGALEAERRLRAEAEASLQDLAAVSAAEAAAAARAEMEKVATGQREGCPAG